MLLYVLVILSIILPIIAQLLLLKKFGSDLSGAIEGIFSGELSQPMVKKAMTVIGKMGGDRQSVNSIKNKLAKGAISKNLGLIKILAEKFVGIDFDELVDEYGAENILTAVQELAPKLGIDVNNIAQSLNIASGSGVNESNPYLKG